MKVLIDTHAFLWAITDDARLSDRTRKIVKAPATEIMLSVASVWEILIKAAAGKLNLPQPRGPYLRRILKTTSTAVLPVLLPHVLHLEHLPLHHRDPFDRIIVAQALEEGLPLITADAKLSGIPSK